METAVIVWLVIVAVCVIVEMISLGLTSIWFAGGALVSAIVAGFNGPLWLQVVLFFVVSVVLLLFTRPMAEKHLNSKLEKTNLDSLIGSKAIVISTINNLEETGQIKLNGIEWTARSNSDDIIGAGVTVNIIDIQGVKAIVEKE